MKKFAYLVLAVMTALSALQGCSSIIYGSRQDLKIDTVPPGAVARIGTQSCVTPCTLPVSRKERYIFITDEHVEREYRLTRTRNIFTYYFGNLLWGIFPGMIMDSITGAKISLDDVSIITREAKAERRR